jgi:hypothetical protein
MIRRTALLLVLAGSDLAAQDTTMVQGGIYQRPFVASVGRTAVGGYAEGNANYLVTDGVTEGFSMELRRFNIFLYSSVGRRLRFTSELEFEHGTEEISLETALVDFVINPSFVLRGGIILPPIGAFNVNHDGPRYEFVDRPIVSTEIIPATLSEIGFGVHGRLAPRGAALSYDAYLTNGLGPGVVLNDVGRTRLASGKSEERFAEDNNGSPAMSARFAAHTPRLGEIGVSAYRGVYNDYSVEGIQVDRKRWVSLLAVDLEHRIGAMEVRGEAAWAFIDVPESLGDLAGDRQAGAYLDLVLPIWRPSIRGLPSPIVNAALRLEHVDFNQGRFGSTDLPIGDELTAFTLGLSFRPAAGTVFRANYRYQWARDPQRNPVSRTAGFQVGFATYF